MGGRVGQAMGEARWLEPRLPVAVGLEQRAPALAVRGVESGIEVLLREEGKLRANGVRDVRLLIGIVENDSARDKVPAPRAQDREAGRAWEGVKQWSQDQLPSRARATTRDTRSVNAPSGTLPDESIR